MTVSPPSPLAEARQSLDSLESRLESAARKGERRSLAPSLLKSALISLRWALSNDSSALPRPLVRSLAQALPALNAALAGKKARSREREILGARRLLRSLGARLRELRIEAAEDPRVQALPRESALELLEDAVRLLDEALEDLAAGLVAGGGRHG